MARSHSLRLLLITNRFPTKDAPDSGIQVPELRSALEKLGVHVTILHINRRAEGRLVYLRLTNRIKRMIAAIDPDVVHVLWGGVVAYLTVRVVTDRPVVVTFAGTDLLGRYFSREEGLLSHLSRFFAVYTSHLAARRARRIIVLSAGLRKALPSSVDPGICRVIPNGVSLEVFHPLNRRTCQSMLGWRPDCKHLLFPGSCQRTVKRFSLALETIAVLKKRGFEVELHDLNHVHHGRMPIYLNAADVILMTSHHEGSPKIIREALACGRPVVSVPVGDVPELLAELPASRLADATPSSIAKHVVAVWNTAQDPEAVAMMTSSTWSKVAADVHRTYLDAVSAMHPATDVSTDYSH